MSGEPLLESGRSCYTTLNHSKTAHRQILVTSLLFKDFTNGLNNRKQKIRKLREISLSAATSANEIKRLMLEIRLLSLRLIEDANEIEYRSHPIQTAPILIAGNNRSDVSLRLPTIAGAEIVSKEEDTFDMTLLAEIITDLDDILRMPRVMSLLLHGFPLSRNPFLVAKTVDELAYLEIPMPEEGNLEDEVKILEMQRMKRSASFLLRCEVEQNNRLPISLRDLDSIWAVLDRDMIIARIVRVSLSVLARTSGTDADAMYFLEDDLTLTTQSHEFLSQLNTCSVSQKTASSVPPTLTSKYIDVLKGCNFDQIYDPTILFLMEWLNWAIGFPIAGSRPSSSSMRAVNGDNIIPDSTILHPQKRALPSIASLNYSDIETFWTLALRDSEYMCLLRVTLCLLNQTNGLNYLDMSVPIDTDIHGLLVGLNKFRNDILVNQKLQKAIANVLNNCPVASFDDPVALFLIEWISCVLGYSIPLAQQQYTALVRKTSLKRSNSSVARSRRSVGRNVIKTQRSEEKSLSPVPIQQSSSPRKSDSNEQVSSIAHASKEEASSARVSFSPTRSDDTRSNRLLPGPAHSKEEPSPKRAEKSLRIGAEPGALPKLTAEVDPTKYSDNYGLSPEKKVEAEIKQPIIKYRREVSPGEVRAQREVIRKQKAKRSKGANIYDRLMRSNDDDAFLEGGQDNATINALRYELIKLQQELLRRKVLDPRFYNAISVDQADAERRGLLSQIGSSAYAPATFGANNNINNKTAKTTQENVIATIADFTVELPDGRERRIELLVDSSSNLTARFIEILYVDVEGTILHRSLVEAMVKNASNVTRETIAYMPISKLLLHRITGLTLERIVAIESMPDRMKALHALTHQLRTRALEVDLKGKLTVEANRVLRTSVISGNGLTAQLEIARNEECDGLILTMHPLSMKISTPVVVELSDDELQVLFLNERSLLKLAMSKWSSMETLAQLIETRIAVKRIDIEDNGYDVSTSLYNVDFGISGRHGGTTNHSVVKKEIMGGTLDNGDFKVVDFEGVGVGELLEDDGMSETRRSIVARIADFPPTSLIPFGSTIADDDVENDFVAVKETKTNDFPLLTATTTTAASNLNSGDQGSLSVKDRALIDIDIDRRVPLAKLALKQWRNRNVSNIVGVTARLHGVQKFGALELVATVIIENDRIRGNGGGLIDYATIDEDVEDIEEYFNDANIEPFVFTLSYMLSSSELEIFGSPSSGAKDGRRIDLIAVAPVNHPASFVWNIISRLKISFTAYEEGKNVPTSDLIDKKNWMVEYDRILVRDLRSISGGGVVTTVKVVGDELFYEGNPADVSIFKQINPKLFTEADLFEIVQGEGWPLMLLERSNRSTLALRILDKLKIVEEGNMCRFEFHTYAETRMLEVAKQVVGQKKPFKVIGTVEISQHHTLSDLRIIIKQELEKNSLPVGFRFLYKGTPCAARQEAFRKAWECYPVCVVIPRDMPIPEGPKAANGSKNKSIVAGAADANAITGILSDQPENASAESLKSENAGSKPRKMVAVPLPTLAVIMFNSNKIYFLHDINDLLMIGDIIRIGNPMGRDYMISMRPLSVRESFPNTAQIEPAFDATLQGGSLESTKMIFGNMPTPSYAGTIGGEAVLKRPAEMGVYYDIVGSGNIFDSKGYSVLNPSNDRHRMSMQEEDIIALDTLALPEGSEGRISVLPGSRASRKSIASRAGLASAGESRCWVHVWVWKCILKSQDQRPKWRRMYDSGAIPYRYEFEGDARCISHFRVPVRISYLEVLCTDSRCRDLTVHQQRVDIMAEFSPDYFVSVAFTSLCDMEPAFHGVSMSKFMKLLRDLKVFPDLRDGTRTSQVRAVFRNELKGEDGINERYINLNAFIRCIEEVAVIRYPEPIFTKQKSHKQSSKAGEAALDDDMSVGSQQSAGGTESKFSGFDDSASYPSLSLDALDTTTIVASASRNPPRLKMLNRQAAKSKYPVVEKKAAPKKKEVTSTARERDPEHIRFAFNKLVDEFMCAHPAWMHIPWQKSKMKAIELEAWRFCAVTRLGAFFRGYWWRQRYLDFRRTLVLLQSHARKRIRLGMTKYLMFLLQQDWLIRRRYHAATTVNALVRRFLTRCWYYRAVVAARLQMITMLKARRLRLRKQREKERRGLIFKETRRINNCIILLQMRKKDSRAYSQDLSMVFSVYIPMYQTTFRFSLEEAELRNYMQHMLNLPAASAGDILDKRNLKLLVTQHMILRNSTKTNLPPRIFFSRQAMGQRGEKVFTAVRVIDDDQFVCTLFITASELTVQAYHQHTCRIFKCSILLATLRDWAKTVLIGTNDSIESYISSSDSRLKMLRSENVKDLYRWAVKNIVIDKRKGKFKILFGIQFERSKKLRSITLIQSVFRMALARMKVMKMVDDFMLAVLSSPGDETVYYLNRETGESSWSKPFLLRSQELLTRPFNRWVSFNYFNGETGMYNMHYVNPLTGRYSHLGMDAAARIIQHLVRRHQVKILMLPIALLTKVIGICRNAKASFDKDRKILANAINYALVKHIVEADEEKAKSAYLQAIDLSESNALVSRSYALFSILTLEAPVKAARERAFTVITSANLRDPDAMKFTLAGAFFQYAALSRHRDARAMIALATANCLIFKNLIKAEKLFRRALAIAPFDERVLEMWTFMKDNFMESEKNSVFYPRSRVELSVAENKSKKRIVHGRPVVEDPKWAG